MAKRSQPYRVLVVDDEPVNRQGFKGALENFGYTVVSVGNGLDAVNEVLENHYDLVLMDCIMPGVDGFEASRRIREREKPDGKRTPIVALSGLTLDEVRQRCFDADMDDFLSKPIALRPLLEVVKRWVGETDAPDANGPDSSPSSDICNPAVLARHRQRGLLGEFVVVLRKDEPLRLARMRSSLEAKDSDRLAGLAHGLAGVAGTLGAESLREAARKLETTARKGDSEVCRVLIEDLANKVEELVCFLEKQLPTQAGPNQ